MNFEEWAGTLTIVGDEAYRPSEKVPRPYHRLTDEEREHYKRDWMRRRREEQRDRALRAGAAVQIVGSLHPLRCEGPTRRTGCLCRGRKTYVVAA